MFRRVGLDGKLLFSVMAVALLAACAPPGSAPDGLVTPPDTVVTSPPAGRPSGDQPMPPVTDQNPYAPQPADDQLMRGNVYRDSIQLLSMESYPPQIALLLPSRPSAGQPAHALQPFARGGQRAERQESHIHRCVLGD
ncbi:MAG: hypothetical protein KKC71_11510 [Chloroflexi bacterium]|nr:hypothetical protein [Chloroflexota bacterium]